MLVAKLSTDEIRRIVSLPVTDMDDRDRDEMAIPSYLHPNPLIRWLMWKRYDVIDQLSELNGHQTVLEFGCGLGLFLPTLAARAARVIALDRFPHYALEMVRRYDLGSKVEFTMDVAKIPEASLDLVVAADVMEHLDDPKGLAATFRRKLKPTGRLVVSGPTESAIYKIGRIFAGFAGKGDYHLTNIDRLERDIVETGFRRLQTIRLPFRLLPCLFKVHAFAAS
ncbi:MAG TPA: methyltransferase domain-containing protein [Candidatus Acidoferrum sp.]|nr:methyltransferase domain-containing protein [Candidatus Acidoferrum sp.]